MTARNEIDALKPAIFSDDWEKMRDACAQLAASGNEEAFQFLLALLREPKGSIRNAAALALRDLGDDRAVEPLLEAIVKPENTGYIGTLVWALMELDCSQHLKEIFAILFYRSYEAKIHAFSILDTQIFEFTREDLLEIGAMWEDCKKHPEKCPLYDDADCRAAIEDEVHNWLTYLDES